MAKCSSSRRIAIAACAALVLALTQAARAQEGKSHSFLPPATKPTPERIATLQHPVGFSIGVFAEGLEGPRWMAVGEDGTVYVTLTDAGKVMALRDPEGKGVATEKRLLFKGLDGPHGIALREGKLYLATVRQVLVAEPDPDGGFERPRVLVDGLPEGGGHPRRTIAFGPDGMLYLTIGSTCNVCEEKNPEHATMLRVAPDGSGREIFAKGLRNVLGFGWDPRTGVLYGMDNGADLRGDDQPPEKLYRIEEGKDYGWPLCIGPEQPDPLLKPKRDCADVEKPVLAYTAHSVPLGLLFYEGRLFPPEYRGDAFVAFHGSWNRLPPSGYKIARIRFEAGQPVAIDDFITGFLAPDGRSQFGRPVGLAVAKDGALLVADDDYGIIYRIGFEGVAVGSEMQPQIPN